MERQPIATVINNNQPGWTNIIETAPHVTLEIGTKLYLADTCNRKDVADLPQIGFPLGGGFFAGEMTVDGLRYALVVAPKAEGQKDNLEYKLRDRIDADGADSDDDGLANCHRINDKNHPAAQFCQSLTIGGFDDWYLPSRDELMQLWRNLGPCRKKTPDLFREDAAEAFGTTWYWSSTENASNVYHAWMVGFDNGYQDYYSKNFNGSVRAVRRVKI